MLARIVVLASLFSCLTAIRDDAALRYGLNTGAALVTDSTARAVPLAVNSAIRKLNGRVSRKMMLSLGSLMDPEHGERNRNARQTNGIKWAWN